MTAKYSTPPDEYAIPTEWRLGDDRDHIRERTWSLVLRGVDNPARYVELFEEELEAAHVSREAAVSFFESVIDLRRAQQEPWGETPTTQLTRAFSGLATIGVLAREDFTCCGGCAVAEIGGERDDSRTWRGYLYYHAQDTDQILERHTTYVGYGAFPDARFSRAEWSALTEEDQRATHTRLVTDLMDEVIPVLTHHGIDVTWDRKLETRILLSNVDFFVPMSTE